MGPFFNHCSIVHDWMTDKGVSSQEATHFIGGLYGSLAAEIQGHKHEEGDDHGGSLFAQLVAYWWSFFELFDFWGGGMVFREVEGVEVLVCEGIRLSEMELFTEFVD